jgi:hypothetical protein
MTAPWTPRTDPEPDQGTEPAAPDELAVLDELEADLAAVELAIESLERVAADGHGGEDAAAQIAAAVSVERFGDASSD